MAYPYGGYSQPYQNVAEEEDDDLYGGFSDPYATPASQYGGYSGYPAPEDSYANFAQPSFAPHTAAKPPGTAFWGAPPGTQAARAGAPDGPRPMTSVRAAGYTSAPVKTSAGRTVFDPLQQAAKPPVPPLQKKSGNTPEEIALEMEKKVNQLIEESAIANSTKDFPAALEKAKEAAKKEKQLCKHRETNGLADQINIDLTYSVAFNLAVQYHANGLYNEALNTYQVIVKNKQYAQAGRLRVNMGNIYFEQKKYPMAIKMYRIALDQIPSTGKEVRYKIMRNIGTSFVRLGQYQDAILSYESIMEGSPDIQTGFNLLLCYYALGDKDKMKRGFTKLMSAKQLAGGSSDDDIIENEDVLKDDALLKETKEKQKQALNLVLTAARLIAQHIEKDWQVGYDYVIEQLKAFEGQKYPNAHLSAELEMSKALQYLKYKKYAKAIEALKSFEKKDTALKTRAATNLSYLYFLEGKYDEAEKYANMSVSADKYNAKALVNLGNCQYVKGSYDQAEDLFREALSVEADCVEGIFNLGLVTKQLHRFEESLRTFRKLSTMVPDSIEVMFHIGNLYDILGEYQLAIDWFNRLISRVPTDPVVLARLGAIWSKEDDESQAFHYHQESYRYHPVNMDVISWLGAYFVKSEVYEKAMSFFERAAQIQPHEVKWQLMVASCHRRIGNYQQAKRLYEDINKRNPDNIECLRYLVHICNDLGLKDDAIKYHTVLKRLEMKAQELQATVAARTRGGAGGDAGGSQSPSMGSNEGSPMAGRRAAPVSMGDDDEQDEAPIQAAPMRSKAPSASSSKGSSGGLKRDAGFSKAKPSSKSKAKDDEDWGDESLNEDLLPM